MNDKVVNMEEHKNIIEDNSSFLKKLEEETKGIDPNLNVYDNTEEKETEAVKMNVLVDPKTGEHKIIGRASEEELKYNFEGIIKQINSNDPDILSTKSFTEKEIISYLKSSDDETLVNEIAPGSELDADTIRDLLDIVNRKINGENFSIYREAPERVKKLIDEYISIGMMTGQLQTVQGVKLNTTRNKVGETLIEQFISDIRMNRAKTNFAKELENIYSGAGVNNEESDNYIEDRNKAYREAANSIEDEDKKSRMNEILDAIEEARNLTKLKEFAKTCKIKAFDLEKPERRVYSNFLSKYRDSVNNIYNIDIAADVLLRHLEPFGYNKKDITVFFVIFCKYCANFSSENVLDHAYMYHVLWYSVMLDNDKSGVFESNVIEVIKNFYERKNA